MKRAGAYSLIAATLAFVASIAIYALRPIPGGGLAGLGEPPFSIIDSEPPIVLTDLFLRPRSAALMLLMALTMIALAWHALRRFQDVRRLRLAEMALQSRRASRRLPFGAGPPTPEQVLEWHRHDVSLAEHGLLIGGLVAGAVCPWLIESQPLAAFLAAVLMLAGVLGAALRGVRHGFNVRKSGALGFAAGWVTLVAFAFFITLLQKKLGVPLAIAGAVGLTLASFAAVGAQLRLGRNISYSVAVILGLIGIAAGTVAGNAALATMAVLAIAVIVVALVQVTT
ncbi:hypothetical protein [Paracoccus laeviglucosivorans]|uniref:Uncharacterized protein n=1 Tax=Paracoccus laeviglucosivorans TaxID=1197861 RepID=A0A521ASX7_9RHOB|nr:hypothetical protein [Paracoccus laeviglucosivorans]SMO37968.1 hypothetical protein SAMN06265221_101328 [Paracoccus laeviglucosivorans]